MKITDEAKKFIQETLTEEKADAIRLHTSNSCCGKSLGFEAVNLTGQEQPDRINDVSILMDQETRAWTDTVTLDVTDGSFTVTDSAASCCGAGCDCGTEDAAPIVEGAMSIKILGPGCKNCVALEQNTKLALTQLGIQANLEKVSDMSAIAGYGIMSTPGLVINEKVVSVGRVLKPKDIVALIEKVAK